MIIQQYMDISFPLHVLKKLIEINLNKKFTHFKFCLQGNAELRDDWNLAEHDIVGNGIVQFHIEIINNSASNQHVLNIIDVVESIDENYFKNDLVNCNQMTRIMCEWCLNEMFKLDNLLFDLRLWSNNDLNKWLNWSIKQFCLDENQKNQPLVNYLSKLNGKKLLEFDVAKERLNYPHLDMFLTHVELLIKFNVVATKKGVSVENTSELSDTIIQDSDSSNANTSTCDTATGQAQLWQFLLELLVDKNYKNIIEWGENEGEFRLKDVNEVARLWGLRKNRANMTYQTFCRALRYYYSNNILTKINRERYLYKFLFDVKYLVGYSTDELNKLVNN